MILMNYKNMKIVFLAVLTYNGKDECVCEMSVERQLHWVSPQLQCLYSVSQAHKYVRGQSRKQQLCFTVCN